MRRKLLALAALLAAWGAGLALLRRRSGVNRERIDVLFEDGSLQSLAAGSADAERLLPLARQALDAARAA